MRSQNPLELSVFDHLGRAFLDARLFIQAVALIALIAALRVWGPVEIQVKIASYIEAPLVRTAVVVRDAFGQASTFARSVEQRVGSRTQSASTGDASTF